MREPQCPSLPRGLPRTAPSTRSARAAASLAAALLALWACGGTAVAVDKPTQPKRLTLFSTASGAALADEKGNPLYLRKADKPNTPGCRGGCTRIFFAAVGFPKKERGVTGTVSHTPHHAPGSKLPQVIFNKHPLYYYKHDHPKQPKGQHVPGFSLVAPDGTPLATAPSGHAAKDRGQIGEATSRPESPAARPEGRSSAHPRKHSAPAHPPAPHHATRHPATPHAKTHDAAPHTATPHPTTHHPAPHVAHPTTTHHPAPHPATTHPSATHHSAKRPPTTHPGTPRPATTHPPALPALPALPATATPGTTSAASAPAKSPAPAASSAPAASTSAVVGALQITPSGAASGGAAHPATADTTVATSATKISLAIGATSAAAAGATLIIRRLQRRAAGGEH